MSNDKTNDPLEKLERLVQFGDAQGEPESVILPMTLGTARELLRVMRPAVSSEPEVMPGHVYMLPRVGSGRPHIFAVAIRPVEQGHWKFQHETLGVVTAPANGVLLADDGPYFDLISAFRMRFQNDLGA